MGVSKSSNVTREHILRAGLRCFAEKGYAASVHEIVSRAKVSKPALYYYFADKAALFEALVDCAHNERYKLMQEAAQQGRTVAEKFEQIVGAVFEFSLKNRELMRLAFSSAFSPPGQMPGHNKCQTLGRRNFEFIRTLVKEGQASGELDPAFAPEDLAMGIYGQINTYVMVGLLVPECPLDRKAAANIVRLFMQGAGNRHRTNGSARQIPATTRARSNRLKNCSRLNT